jgi:hypothetical protein
MSKKLIRYVIVYLLGVLICLPLISYPGLIDGISYPKLMFCLFLATPFFVFIVSDVHGDRTDFVTKSLFSFLVLSVLGILYSSFFDYRAVFGAPGRSNGIISIFLGLLFVYFGIFLQKHSQALILIKALIISSTLSSSLSLLSSLQVGPLISPSLDFGNADFRDNTNLLAPLFAMGVVGAILLTFTSKKPLYLLSQLPSIVFIVKWSLLQSYLAIFLGIFVVVAIKRVNLVRFIPFFPVAIIVVYLSSLLVLSLNKFQVGSSIYERFQILNFARENFNLFTFLPQKIDGLSDYTYGVEFISKTQFLDDFHNVFLQILFSYGFFVGLFIFLAFSSVFLRIESYSNQQLILLPLFTAFYVTLFFGILSANYMYFGLTILGFLISRLDRKIVKKRDVERKMLSILLSLLFVLPLYVSAVDMNRRFEISRLTFTYEESIEKIRVVEEITSRTEQIDDAEYRFFVARNLFAIGECTRAERIILRIKETNALEFRLYELEKLRQEAICIKDK